MLKFFATYTLAFYAICFITLFITGCGGEPNAEVKRASIEASEKLEVTRIQVEERAKAEAKEGAIERQQMLATIISIKDESASQRAFYAGVLASVMTTIILVGLFVAIYFRLELRSALTKVLTKPTPTPAPAPMLANNLIP